MMTTNPHIDDIEQEEHVLILLGGINKSILHLFYGG